MSPAHESLDAGEDPTGQVDDRLVQQEELVGLESGVQIHFEMSVIVDGLLHFGSEDHRASLAGRFGLVERYIGVSQQIVRRFPSALGDADAGRHGQGRLAAGDLKWGGHDVKDPICHHVDPGVEGGALRQHHELVTSEAPDAVLLADCAGQPGPHRGQELVSRGVAQSVIDVLEVVEI